MSLQAQVLIVVTTPKVVSPFWYKLGVVYHSLGCLYKHLLLSNSLRMAPGCRNM